nr:hypothetical protein StreXyl84_57450 [Streptomyces sp. Xyl84]
MGVLSRTKAHGREEVREREESHAACAGRGPDRVRTGRRGRNRHGGAAARRRTVCGRDPRGGGGKLLCRTRSGRIGGRVGGSARKRRITSHRRPQEEGVTQVLQAT